jgi:hypothetical protein
MHRIVSVLMIGGGATLLLLPLGTAIAAALPFTVGFHIDAKGFVVLVGLAIAGTALSTSGIWLVATSKSR